MIDIRSFNSHSCFTPELHLAKDGVGSLFEYEIKCHSSVALSLKSILDKFKFYNLVFKEGISHAQPQYYESECGQCVISYNLYHQGQTGWYLNVYHIAEYEKKFEELRKEIDKYKIEETESKENKVNFISQYGNGMELMEKELKRLDVHIEDYELSLPFEKIKEEIENDKAGLVLFSGQPGVGKSSFIRHLISICNKKFVYIPVNVAQVLSDPSFINFAMENLSNSVIIIEDAETVLADRQKSYNAAASTLLNLTDGLLGELLGIRVLATINTEDGVDSALLRKGRLLSKVTFEKLGYEKSKNLLKRIGKRNVEINKETKYSLAELYNIDKENGEEQKERRSIGFKK